MIHHVRAGVQKPVLDYLEAAAELEQRSLANMAGKILTDFVNAERQKPVPVQDPEAAQ